MRRSEKRVQKIKRVLRSTLQFAIEEAQSGKLLILSAVIAIIIANTGLGSGFSNLLKQPLFGTQHFSIKFVIDDALMSIFFLLVGLEVKREFIDGELRSLKHSMVPLFSAVGGMLLPALIFLSLNYGTPAVAGWGIPMATDIAFSLAILATCSKQVPLSVRIFLTALAIIDDLGAVIVIALWYTKSVNMIALLSALAVWLALYIYQRKRGEASLVYIIGGIGLWLAVLLSGVHATIAGVMLALTIPIKSHREGSEPLLQRWEHGLAPWVNYGVMPLFALANAGIAFTAEIFSQLTSRLTLGIGMGLVVGKSIGILGAAWLAIRFAKAELPRGASWRQIFGVALLGGIGFTMSLFISNLALKSGEQHEAAKLGIVVGSFVAAVSGFIVLRSGKRAGST